MCLTFGTCEKYKYSLRDKDPEDGDFCRLQEGPMTKGETTDLAEWSNILTGRLMVNRDFHYYVRESGLTNLLRDATERLVRRLA